MPLPLVLRNLRNRAAQNPVPRLILLPEFADPRVLSAARKIIDTNVAKVGLSGDKMKILARADELKIDLRGVTILDTHNSDIVDVAAARLIHRRKGKESLSMSEARSRVLANHLDFANLLVSADVADGVVAGSLATTAAVARSAIQCVGLGPTTKTASSFFVMAKEDKWKILADCGFIVDPTVEQLSCIAGTTARSTRALLGVDPIVAMLSFSTRGSASHPHVDKVRQAMELARLKNPGLIIDGEMQADAALDPEVCESKAPGSVVGGKANVLIFPDLQSGNIAYKLLQRLGGYEAIGPILQGFARPTNDLSRGCSDEDIVNAVAVAALQANDTAPTRSSDLGEVLT